LGSIFAATTLTGSVVRSIQAKKIAETSIIAIA
jgi:hypothetical protein